MLGDAEAVAARELGKLAAALWKRIFLPHLFIGIVAGIVGYWLLRETLLDRFGFHMPQVTGACTFVPCLLGSVWLGRRAADAAVRLAMRGWCTQLVQRYRLAAGTL